MASEPCKRMENGEREADVVQTGPMKNFLKRDVPLQVKKETEEQRWETQLQEFLKKMDPPHSGERPPQFPEPMFEEDTKESQASTKEITNQGPRRERASRPPSWASEDLLKGASQPNGGLESSVNMEKLLSEDAVSSEFRRQRFRLFCYESAKGPREVCKQLWKLCHQWLKPERRSKDQILDVLILEHFLTVLPSEMQSWVMERSPENCSQAVAMAEEFLQSLKEPEKWGKEEPEIVLESFVSTPKSEQEPLDPIQMQLSEKVKQEDDEESNFFDNGEVQESEEESSHLQKHDQVAICGISLQGLETDLMHENPPVPEVHWGNHSVEVNKHEEDPNLHSNGCSEEINHLKIKKEQIDDMNFKDLNSQVEEVAEKPHMCFYCGMTSRCKAELVIHQRTHSGEKPYTCLDCGIGFNRKSTLMRHKRMHTGERPYECAKCGRRFSVRCNLTNHERIHTGEKPYSCSICGQSFSRRMQFVIHNRTHTGETPHRCTQCGKCFTRRSSLLTHERNHTGKKTNTVAWQVLDELSECSKDDGLRLVISEESVEDSRGLERDVLESPGRSQATGESDISSHETRPEWPLEENVGDESFSKSSCLEIRRQNINERQNQFSQSIRDNERESRCAQSDVMGGIEAFLVFSGFSGL